MTTTKQLHEINAFTLKQWLDKNEALLIDVRESAEFLAEHISGAQLISLSQFDSTLLPDDSHQKIVLQCQSGNRSAQAAKKMLEAGFTEVFHLQGGLPTWKAAGYPTTANKKAISELNYQDTKTLSNQSNQMKTETIQALIPLLFIVFLVL